MSGGIDYGSPPSWPGADAAPGRVRPIVIGICPACAGLGSVPYAGEEDSHGTLIPAGGMSTCLDCGGSGDLYDAQLRAAFNAGRREVLDHVSYIGGELQRALKDAIDSPPPSKDRLRQIVGGG